MKANGAPERLYLDATSKCGDTVFTIRNNDTDVEYTRTDAFIEKACDWLEPVLKNYAGYYRGKDVLGDFKKYMEGE